MLTILLEMIEMEAILAQTGLQTVLGEAMEFIAMNLIKPEFKYDLQALMQI